MEIKISELARAVGVNIQTIRYYERCRLLQPSRRIKAGISGIGYRIYNEDALRKLKFILHAKELGFTLKETGELLNMSISTTARCADIKKKAEEKLKEITKKIEGLHGIQKILKDLVSLCRSKQPTDRCPILKAIDEKGR